MRIVEFRGLVISKGKKHVFHTLSGFDSGTVSRTTQTYAGQDGGDITERYYDMRDVTIDGHILAENRNELEKAKRKLIEAFDGKTFGELVYIVDGNRYTAKALSGLPMFGKEKNTAPYGLPYSVSLTIPGFYWKGPSTNVDIYSRINKITGDFILPCVFTERTNKKTIVNYGAVSTPMLLEITSTASGVTAVEVKNITTGDYILVEKELEQGEVLLIDTDELTAESSIDGNVLHLVTSDSVIDMQLACGVNEIECNFKGSGGIAAKLQYSSRFLGV